MAMRMLIWVVLVCFDVLFLFVFVPFVWSKSAL